MKFFKIKNKVTSNIKFYIFAGQATSAAPLGPILGQNQIQPNTFIQNFNQLTKNIETGVELPIKLIKKMDKSYSISYNIPTLYNLVQDLLYLEKQQSTSSVVENAIDESSVARQFLVNIILPRSIFYDIFRIYSQFMFSEFNKKIDKNDSVVYTKNLLGTLRSMKIRVQTKDKFKKLPRFKK